MFTSSSTPRATLSQAHDSNVWSLTFHPLGHLLVSASNDHTTRFWSRELPGYSSSVFSGGGEKPPEITDTSGQDEDDDIMVPGFGTGYFGNGNGIGSAGGQGGGDNWWSRDGDGSTSFPMTTDTVYGRAGYTDANSGDDFIPGFSSSSRQNPYAPPQQPETHMASDECSQPGTSNRQSRWGPRKGAGGRH